MNQSSMRFLSLFVLTAGLLGAPPRLAAGSLNVDGDLAVTGNVSAASLTLGGQTHTNWPSPGGGVTNTIQLLLEGPWTYPRSGSIANSNNAAPIYVFNTTASEDITGFGFYSSFTPTQSRYASMPIGVDVGDDWGGDTGLLIGIYMSSTSAVTNQAVLRVTSANKAIQWSTTVVATVANTVQCIPITTNVLGAFTNWLTTGPTNVSTLRVDFQQCRNATNAVVNPTAVLKVIK